MAACPHPDKKRYATHSTADLRGRRAELRNDQRLYPYQCICGWWHLTSNPRADLPTWATPRPEDIHRLTHMTCADFTVLVSEEARSITPLPDRIALRHPHLNTRWRRTLKALITDVNRQLSNRPHTGLAHDTDWRARAERFRDTLTVRLRECQTLRTHTAPQEHAA